MKMHGAKKKQNSINILVPGYRYSKLSYGVGCGGIVFHSMRSKTDCTFSTLSRPTLRTIQPPSQWLPERHSHR